MRTRTGKLIKVINSRQNKSTAHEYRAVMLKENNVALAYIFTETELEVAYARYNKFMDVVLERSVISKILD